MQTEIAEVLSNQRRWTVQEGDAMEVMRSLPAESVDAVVTDPPYGIGKTYAGGKEAASDAESYWKWLEPFYRLAYEKVKPGGLVAVWQTQLYFKHFWEWFGDDIHIYAAAKNFVQIRKVSINYAYDPVVMLYKPGAPHMRPVKPRRSFDFFVANTAKFGRRKNNPYAYGHPCPRPLDQCKEIVENFTLPNAVVLDPFAGAGTIGVAAVQTGRRFVGIELAPEYVNTLARPWLTEAEAALQNQETVA